MGWIDVSIALHNSMIHWPGDPPFVREMVADIAQGDGANLSKLSMGSHSGTHVDAPRHFIGDGLSINAMPLEAMIGVSRVIEISNPQHVTPAELQPHHIRRGERILFKTRNSSSLWDLDTFSKEYVSLSAESADYLVDRKIKLVGIDYLSVGGVTGRRFVCTSEIITKRSLDYRRAKSITCQRRQVLSHLPSA